MSKNAGVGEGISIGEGFRIFLDNLTGLLIPLLPHYAAKGKSYLTITIGCTGGRHHSVFVAEIRGMTKT